MCAGMQDGEGEKQKSYLARCRLPCPVTDAMLAQLGSMKDVVLQQTTPARVEHRRAMLVMPLAVFKTTLASTKSWRVPGPGGDCTHISPISPFSACAA